VERSVRFGDFLSSSLAVDINLYYFFFLEPKGVGKVTAGEVKRRLATFYKNISTKEIKFLLNNQPEITFNDLFTLLKDNQLHNFDPVKEAFKVYDPNETGYVDMNVIKECFQDLNYGEVSDEDIKIILETADADKDGRIGLEDFRMMVPFSDSASSKYK
jgi:Ca2+-binding EF-hand superfamily protein